MVDPRLPPIPQEWMEGYIDELLRCAKVFGPNSPMGTAALLRADHAMDIIQAWRESHAKGWRMPSGS